MQSKPTALELATVLALHRGGSLAAAATLLGADGSTVFRNLRRLEQHARPLVLTEADAGEDATHPGEGVVLDHLRACGRGAAEDRCEQHQEP